MVLVGGIGTYEGPILGAVLFFTIEALFGATGVTYLIGLGATAMLFALLLPRGIWGEVEHRLGLQLLPIGYQLKFGTADRGPSGPRRKRSAAATTPATPPTDRASG